MLNKLEAADKRYEQILEELSMPEVVSDQNKYKELMREQKITRESVIENCVERAEVLRQMQMY